MSNQTKAVYYDLNTLPKIWDRQERQEWLIQGFLPKNGITVFTGATGSGKSSVALVVANCLVQGKPFLGHEVEKTKVLIVDRENPLYVYTERFIRFGIQEHPDLNFWGMWDVDLEPQGPDYFGIEKYAEEHHPLIIFDSLIAFHPESEQDASETRKYMHLFRKLVAKGCSVLIIHHTGKGTEGVNKFYRGSSDIPANADVAWLLEQKPSKEPMQNMHLTKFKSREGLLANMHFGLNGTEFVLNEFIENDDPVYALIDEILQAHPRINQTQICSFLPEISRPKLLKMLNLGSSHAVGRYIVHKGLNNASLYTLGKTPDAQNPVVRTTET